MIYIIYDMEQWEILGIEKAFSKREYAELYLKEFWDTENEYMRKLKKKLTFEEFCNSEIVEIELNK